MASTNKTTNYELSQFIGTDKPTWLTDYNGDMNKIDAQMKTNADNVSTAMTNASTAISTANSANTTAGQANTTANTANSTANTASTTATNAQSTANSALGTATSAQTKANAVESDLNAFKSEFALIPTSYDKNSADVTVSGGSIYNRSITIARSSDGAFFKIYGLMNVYCTANNFKITITNTGIATDSEYTITPAGVIDGVGYVNVTVKNNSIEISAYVGSPSSSSIRSLVLYPCFYINKDFGDTPTEE